MYADENGTLLDVNDEQYFEFDATHFTCNVIEQVVQVKSVFIGQLGNLIEFTCNYVDCADTVLGEFTDTYCNVNG